MARTEWPNVERVRFVLFSGLSAGPPYITTLWRLCRAFPEYRRPPWIQLTSQAERGLVGGAFRDPGGEWRVRLSTVLVESGRLWEAIGEALRLPGMQATAPR